MWSGDAAGRRLDGTGDAERQWRQLMGLPLREAREVFEREYLVAQIKPLRRQHFAHRRIRRQGALGAAPQAQGAGDD
jgi:hypothetical protein